MFHFLDDTMWVLFFYVTEDEDDISTAALIRELERHVTISRQTRARVASNEGEQSINFLMANNLFLFQCNLISLIYIYISFGQQ